MRACLSPLGHRCNIEMSSFPFSLLNSAPIFSRFRMALYFAYALVLCNPSLAFSQDDFDADGREVNAYVLTTTGLNQFRQAAIKLGEFAESVAGNCDDEEGDNSLDGMVARIRDIPGAAEAIESTGMSVRNYVLFMFATFQAGVAVWSLDQPGGALPPGVSMANVNFYQDHAAEFQETASLMPQDECNGTEDESYDE